MKTIRLVFTLATLFSLCQSAHAQGNSPEAYAVLDDNGTLTYYYGTNKPESDNVYDIPWDNSDDFYPLWPSESINEVIIDPSFSGYQPESMAYLFSSLGDATSISGLEYLNTSQATSMESMFDRSSNLKELDLSNLNTSNVENMAYMFYECNALTSLDLTNFNTSKVINMSGMFYECFNLETIYCYDDWSIIDRSDDFISEDMFYGCESLPGFDYGACNDITFAKPISMGGYFNNIQAYATIANGNLTFFYDENKPASGSFELTNTGGGSWKDASFSSVTFDESIKDYKFTSTADMFSGLKNLTVINYLTYLNTSTITNMSNMFSGCSSLATIYCNNDWSSLTIPSDNMFLGCTQLDGYNSINVSITYANPTEGGYFTPYRVAYAELNEGTLTFYYDLLRGTRQGIVYDLPWEDYYPEWYIQDPEEGGDEEDDEEDNEEAPVRKAMARTMNSDITMVVFDDSFHDFDGFTSTKNMFFGLSNLESIEGLENLNTENVTNMSRMFQGCESLTALDLSGFNTGKVSDMNYMFSNCSSLTTLDLSNFITGNVTDMNNMFENCEALTSLDVTNFNTENVTKMNGMFTFCEALTSLDLANFNTGKVEYMDYMFSHCSSITSLDLTNFDVTKVKRVECMFANCSNLVTIFCNDDWADKESSRDMFLNCENLVGAKSYSSSHEVWGYEVANPTEGYFTYGLRDNADNSSLIASTSSMPRVGLVGRTLYKTGDWNTLCLPFSLTARQLNESSLAGYSELRTLKEEGTTFDPATGTLTLNFTPATGDDAVTSIEAGKPYIIKWNSGDENIVNPTFTDVTISSTLSPVVASSVSFMGTYDPKPLTSANSNILYLGAGNTLYYPSANMTINAFRAYFELNLTSGQQVKAINLNFGDEENGIKEITTDSNSSNPSNTYFSLDGLRLLDKPTQKGMYINNGRKVLIK